MVNCGRWLGLSCQRRRGGLRTLDSMEALPTPEAPRINIRMVGLSEPLRRPISGRMGCSSGREACLFVESIVSWHLCVCVRVGCEYDRAPCRCQETGPVYSVGGRKWNPGARDREDPQWVSGRPESDRQVVAPIETKPHTHISPEHKHQHQATGMEGTTNPVRRQT